MESYDDIWQAVLEYCRQRTNETAYSLWLSTIEFTDLKDNTVTLKFSSSLKRNIVVAQYGHLLEEAFDAVMGFQLDIDYTCDEDKISQEEFDEKNLVDYKNNQYTFDNFIVGPSNRFAFAAAKAVSTDPGSNIHKEKSLTNYNPLFIYGNSGLGKTHILNAISNEINKMYPEMNVFYIKTEEFTNEFILALQNHTIDEFHRKYRTNIDVLLVDDIQFINGKTQTEEEFFHTFNALVDNGKQVVLTSDRPPKEILSISDRMRNRFENGILADIQPPEYDTRCAIIKRKAEILNFEISENVINFIAEKIKSNIRQLEGVTNKLRAMSNINGQSPTIALAQNVIKDIVEDTQPLPVTVQHIVEEVSRTTGVSVEDIYSKVQKANISHARKITFYVIRKVTNMSYESIGEEFKKHHSTVMYNINQIEEEIEINSKLARQVTDIINNVKDFQ